jgi:hypothetical protein
MGEYEHPTELISFLRGIYSDTKFDNIVEIKIRKAHYFCLYEPGGRYVREDYFSSGEYFLVSLYRRIRTGYKLIFVDEIDISLDPSAQVRLIAEMRKLCIKYGVRIAFTSHSLAMMQTLEAGELNYVEIKDGNVSIRPASFNYIKSLLFGFRGWDRYVLTEDEMLKDFLEYILARYCQNIFSTYIIIYIGAASNVSSLLERNSAEGFFGETENVIAVLDGDKASAREGQKANTYCIPIDSVEKGIFALSKKADFPFRLKSKTTPTEAKALFKQLLFEKVMSKQSAFKLLCDSHEGDFNIFARKIQSFLT